MKKLRNHYNGVSLKLTKKCIICKSKLEKTAEQLCHSCLTKKIKTSKENQDLLENVKQEIGGDLTPRVVCKIRNFQRARDVLKRKISRTFSKYFKFSLSTTIF